MMFTVVRAVRGAESTASQTRQRLQRATPPAVPARTVAMDLPYAERVLRLDFISVDFPKTVPGSLS